MSLAFMTAKDFQSSTQSKPAGMTGSSAPVKCMCLTQPPPNPSSPSCSHSHSSAMCCGAPHLWTLLNGALVWPDSSPLLHFPSNLPAQPSDCHRKAVKTFHSFCIAALFPQHCLTIAIFYRTLRFMCLLRRLHFSPLCSLFINRLFPPTRCML